MEDTNVNHCSPEWAANTLAAARARVTDVIKVGDRQQIREELADLGLLHDAVERAACELACEAHDLGAIAGETVVRTALRGLAGDRLQLASDLADQASRLQEFTV